MSGALRCAGGDLRTAPRRASSVSTSCHRRLDCCNAIWMAFLVDDHCLQKGFAVCNLEAKGFNCSHERLRCPTSGSLTIYDDVAAPSSCLYAHKNGDTRLEARYPRRIQAKHDIYERREPIAREVTHTVPGTPPRGH